MGSTSANRAILLTSPGCARSASSIVDSPGVIGTRVSSTDRDVSPDAGWMDGGRSVTPGTHTTRRHDRGGHGHPTHQAVPPPAAGPQLQGHQLAVDVGHGMGDAVGQPGAQPVLN